MTLPRLRELLAAWQDGTIREAELRELRDALPSVFRRCEDLLPLTEEYINGLAVESLPPSEHVEYDDGFTDGFATGWRACEARWQRRD